MELSWSGKILVITLFFRLLFGGYLMGMDQYNFNDVDSALTVLAIYGLIAVFTALFMLGKRIGLMGIIVLDAIFVVLQSFFTIASLSQLVNAGLHNPIANWWAILLMFVFSALTLTFAVKTYRETKQSTQISK